MASAASYSTLVQDLYVAYFGRPADYFGLQNFESALAAANAPIDAAGLATAYSTNAAVKSLVDSFGTSAESIALYGSGSTESFVNAVFENLFGRPAAVAGLTFWVNAIESGQVSQGDAALAILAGAENNTTTQGKADWLLIGNKVAVANNFTTDLGNSSTQIVDYSGASAAQQARLLLASVTGATDPTTFDVQTTINNIVAGNSNNTYNLTTGVDTITGGPGNNTFNAILDNALGVAAGGQAATLQSFDTITGGTLNNTLNITDFGLSGDLAIPAGASITGITTLNISSLESIDSDVSGMASLTTVNIKAAVNGVDLTVGNNVALTVTDAGGNVSLDGGSTIVATVTGGGTVGIEAGVGASSVSVTGGGGAGSFIEDANYGGSKAQSLSNVTLSSVDGSYDINSSALTSLTINTQTGGTDTVNAATGTRTLGLTLNGDAGVTVSDATATTVAVTAATADSSGIVLHAGSATALSFDDSANLSFTTLDASAAKAVTITGAGDFTADLGGLAAAAAINATGSSGAVTVNLAAAGGQSFVGGSGADVVSIGAAQTGTVTGGSAGTNEIVLNNAPAATVADIASVTHFSVFGVAGSTSGVFDLSKLSGNGAGYTSFDVQGSGGNVTFTNAATGSSLSLENGNSNIITLQTADANGANDSVNVTLGTTTSGGNNYSQVTVEDSAFVGTATVKLTMNAASSNSLNYLGSLFDQNLVTLDLSGNANSEIGTVATDSATLTINNTGTSTGDYSYTIDSLTDNHLTTLTFGGTNGLVVDTFNSTSASLTVVDNSTGVLFIDTFNDTALTSATFTNSVNSTSAVFVVGDVLGVMTTQTEASLATLNLNGNVEIYIGGDTVATGITVAGGTDNAIVHFTGTEVTASGATDSITLGNGAGDSVTLGAGLAGSTQTVVLGSGAGDTITSTSVGTVNATVGSGTAGTDTITANDATTFHATAGNGTNVISDSAAGAAITISVGTGANTITVGADTAGTISLGAHAATVVDAITLGASGTSLTAIEKISGLNNIGGDTLTFSGETANTIASFTQVTAGSVVASGGDTTLLADWVAAADGLGGHVTGAAHTVEWFQYQGNTYLLESVAGATADAGTMVAGNTLVELVGTGYTFTHATGAAGTVHLVNG